MKNLSSSKTIDGKVFLHHIPRYGLNKRREAEVLRTSGYYARVINGRIYIRPKNMPKKYSMTIPKDAIPPRKMSWIETRPNTLSYRGSRAKKEAASFIYYKTKVLDQEHPTTDQILAHLNEKYQHGYTANQIGNFLAKDPRFIGAGMTGRPQRQKKWDLTEP